MVYYIISFQEAAKHINELLFVGAVRLKVPFFMFSFISLVNDTAILEHLLALLKCTISFVDDFSCVIHQRYEAKYEEGNFFIEQHQQVAVH